MRIGVVNWDCSLPPNTFFGSYFAKTLSFKKWRSRTPYYADVLSEDNVCCHYRTAQEFDQELEYAIAAKIDYFAYVWHSDNRNAVRRADLPTSVTHPHVWTQDHARKLHQQSALAQRIKLCAIILSSQPYIPEDFQSMAQAMKQPYYETVNGRPLVYVFGGYRLDVIEQLRTFPKQYGTEDPYIVFMNNGVKSENGDYSKADAVSAYACENKEDIDTYAELIDILLAQNQNRLKYNVNCIPLFTVGWDPTPRIETPIPWYSYPKKRYAKDPTPEELEQGALRLAEWMRENRGRMAVDHVLTFAWNEFEEGAYLCPTLNPDDSANTDRVECFARIVDIFNAVE